MSRIIVKIIRGLLLSVIFLGSTKAMALPDGFVYLQEIAPTIIQDMKYFSKDNFIGRPVRGYDASACILSKEASLALLKVQQRLTKQSLSLKVYDCYRPQMAVDDFIQWSQDPADQKMKKIYYPRVDKSTVFDLGYVAAKSGHTRGSTVDLTIVHLVPENKSPTEMDMGTYFDYMDETSHFFSDQISKEAMRNRSLLRTLMEEMGFNPYEKEWWHFTLKNEPFPETYFNFSVR